MLFQSNTKHENNCKDRTQSAGTVLSLHLISLICVIHGSIFEINKVWIPPPPRRGE